MRVCIDTNVLVQLFGNARPYAPIADALQQGKLQLAVSNEILFEYEEIVSTLSGHSRWVAVITFLEAVSRLHGNIFYIEPHFRFHVVSADADDNKFADCAIAAEADFIVTSDRHFDALKGSGYKPRPIDPSQFIAQYL